MIQTSRSLPKLKTGPPVWGHHVKYGLEVIDTASNPYAKGAPKEVFKNLTFAPGHALYHPGAPGTASTWPVGAYFTDNNESYEPVNLGNVGWYTFSQEWHLLEGATNWKLNTHSIDHYRDGVSRSY